MEYRYHDGGRTSSKSRRDCVCRAIAIASGLDYSEIWDSLTYGKLNQRKTKRTPSYSNADSGVLVKRKWFKDYMNSLGFFWTPTMKVGTGCKIHLRSGELPNGRLVVSLSRHYSAVIDNVIYDIYDPSRNGTRCVYGFWTLEKRS
jgi:hypothetical protein